MFGSTCRASYLLCPDTWGGEAVPEEASTGQALVTTATNPLSVQPGGEDNKFCHVSCLSGGPVPGKTGNEGENTVLIIPRLWAPSLDGLSP